MYDHRHQPDTILVDREAFHLFFDLCRGGRALGRSLRCVPRTQCGLTRRCPRPSLRARVNSIVIQMKKNSLLIISTETIEFACGDGHDVVWINVPVEPASAFVILVEACIK